MNYEQLFKAGGELILANYADYIKKAFKLNLTCQAMVIAISKLFYEKTDIEKDHLLIFLLVSEIQRLEKLCNPTVQEHQNN